MDEKQFGPSFHSRRNDTRNNHGTGTCESLENAASLLQTKDDSQQTALLRRHDSWTRSERHYRPSPNSGRCRREGSRGGQQNQTLLRGRGVKRLGRRGEGRHMETGEHRNPVGRQSITRSIQQGHAHSHAPAEEVKVLTNILLAQPTPNFMFYMYSVSVCDRLGNTIESASRCNHLVFVGLFDNLLKNLSRSDKESRKRMTFLCGSFFFSSSLIPGLESLPCRLLDGTSSEQDTVVVKKVQCFVAPRELHLDFNSLEENKKDVASVDIRCSDCTLCFLDWNAFQRHCHATGHRPVQPEEHARPASIQVFSQYANMIIKRAMTERMARWGKYFVDPQSFVTPRKRNGQEWGVHVFQAYHVEFNVGRPEAHGPAKLMLTVDLTAKIIRSKGILYSLCRNQDPNSCTFSDQAIRAAKKFWIGQQVISKLDKTSYSIHDLVFEECPDSLPVGNLGISHSTYYREHKKFVLKFPAARPMVAVVGRNQRIIYLPPEIVCANDFDDELRAQLPQITSFKPQYRSDAIEVIQNFLVPKAQSSRNASSLLPALGIVLCDDRLRIPAKVLPLPRVVSYGLSNNGSKGAPQMAKANYQVDPKKATLLCVILIHHRSIEWEPTYRSIAYHVNKHKTAFRFPDRPFKIICAENDMDRHWGVVETHFGSSTLQPPNLFVLDFTKPTKVVDQAYPILKKMFASGGILSQFVNFTNCDHQATPNVKRSNIILSSVSRQILMKAGSAIWWTEIPHTLPLPSVFIGVDVYHAPRVYDPSSHRRIGRPSVAAIVVRVIRDHSNRSKVECYSETFQRKAGDEFDLGGPIEQTLCNALKCLHLKDPKSCILWRDGVPDTAIAETERDELQGIQRALGSSVPVAIIVCQKRIALKFFTDPSEPKSIQGMGRTNGMPAGTLVEGCAHLDFPTFYINGSAPPYATPKPVRFLVAHQDVALFGGGGGGADCTDAITCAKQAKSTSCRNTNANQLLMDLTWSQMSDYPNWSGTIKVPACCQLAHLLAEHAGAMDDSGVSMDHVRFTNHLYFL